MERNEFRRVTALLEQAMAWKRLIERHGSTFSPVPRCRVVRTGSPAVHISGPKRP